MRDVTTAETSRRARRLPACFSLAFDAFISQRAEMIHTLDSTATPGFRTVGELPATERTMLIYKLLNAKPRAWPHRHLFLGQLFI